MRDDFFERVQSISVALRGAIESTGEQFRPDATTGVDVRSALSALPTLFPRWVNDLQHYDGERFGPLLGVSDEGSAGETIARAACASAKARALPAPDPSAVGVVIDGERMTSAGEVPIGPDEYRDIVLAAFGRTHCSTNVGVRANARHYQPLPEFEVAEPENDLALVATVVARFQRFVARERSLTCRLRGPKTNPVSALRRVIGALETARRAGSFLGPELHRFTFLLSFEDEISPARDLCLIEEHLAAAAELGVPEVALDAEVLPGSRRRLSVQGLLNILQPRDLQLLLTSAQQHGVRLTLRDRLDTESAARTIWTGLHTARTHGLSAGKFGLIPLTLDEQQRVVESVLRWTQGWTAIPAFYVDTPLLTADAVYDSDRCEEAAVLWMDRMAAVGAKVVLIDSPDRIGTRRLLKAGRDDEVGVLTLEGVERVSAHARQLGLRVLWSGGITPVQAFELAQRGVGGIFTTSSTAARVAVGPVNAGDPQLAEENEPTELGVRKVHALIQGGFLASVLSDARLRQSIEEGSRSLLAQATDDSVRQALAELDQDLVSGWQQHWRSRSA